MSFSWGRSGPFQTLPRHWRRLRLQVRFRRKQSKINRRVRHPDIAPCHCQTSQGATRQLRTLRLSHVAPCNIALSHLATFACRTLRLKKPAFDPLKPLFPTPSRRSAWMSAASQNQTSATPFGMRRSPHSSFLIDIRFLQYSSQSGSSFCMTQLESGSSFCCIRGKSNSFSFTQRIDIRNQILYYIAQTKSYYGF